MSEVCLVIPEIPSSMNKFLNNNRSRHIYQKEKKYWAELIKYAALEKKWQHKPPIKKATVGIIYYFRTKTKHDPDNYSGKFLLDGLKQAGIIEDDSFGHVELVLRGEVDRENPRTEIRVREVTM